MKKYKFLNLYVKPSTYCSSWGHYWLACWGMLSVNGRRSRARVTWPGCVKGVRNLERCANDFSCWLRNLGRPDDHVRRGRNGIEVEWVWLCGVSKRMGRLVVRLKAIEYKEDFFCYLSSYLPDLGLQATCLLTLFFRPYAFRTSYPWRNEFVHPSLESQIVNVKRLYSS